MTNTIIPEELAGLKKLLAERKDIADYEEVLERLFRHAPALIAAQERHLWIAEALRALASKPKDGQG